MNQALNINLSAMALSGTGSTLVLLFHLISSFSWELYVTSKKA